MKDLNPITIKSEIVYNFLQDEEELILVAQFSGHYRVGSRGNTEGNFIFAKLCEHYFWQETFAIVLDFRLLIYSWGNTLLKSINFFSEIARDDDEKNKKMCIVVAQHNETAIYELAKFCTEGQRVFFHSYEQAVEYACRSAKEYLDIY